MNWGITYITLIALAAACDAVIDTLDDHYGRSWFRRLNPFFWDAEISWKNKYLDWDGGDHRRRKWFWNINKPVQVTDGWHFFKMLMIVFMCGAAVASTYSEPWLATRLADVCLRLFVTGTVWNLTFSLFYNKLLIDPDNMYDKK